MNSLQVLLYCLLIPNPLWRFARSPTMGPTSSSVLSLDGPIWLTIISSSWQYDYPRQTASADDRKGFPCTDFQPDESCAPYPGSLFPFQYVLEFSLSLGFLDSTTTTIVSTQELLKRAISLPTRTCINTLTWVTSSICLNHATILGLYLLVY